MPILGPSFRNGLSRRKSAIRFVNLWVLLNFTLSALCIVGTKLIGPGSVQIVKILIIFIRSNTDFVLMGSAVI